MSIVNIELTRVYDSKEAAEVLHVSTSTIQRWSKSRRLLSCSGLKGKYLFLGETLIDFYRSNAQFVQMHQRRAAA